MPTTSPTFWGAATTYYAGGDAVSADIIARANGGFVLAYVRAAADNGTPVAQGYTGAGAAAGGNLLSTLFSTVAAIDGVETAGGSLVFGVELAASPADHDIYLARVSATNVLTVTGVETSTDNSVLSDVANAVDGDTTIIWAQAGDDFNYAVTDGMTIFDDYEVDGPSADNLAVLAVELNNGALAGIYRQGTQGGNVYTLAFTDSGSDVVASVGLNGRAGGYSLKSTQSGGVILGYAQGDVLS